jgi:hypothetical protein
METVKASTIIMMLAFFVSPVAAQEEGGQEQADELLHYSYSTVMGSGWYKVGKREVAVIEAPFFIRQHDAEGLRPGFRWLLPVSLGFHDFDGDVPESDEVATVSFVPGIELEFPVAYGWLLRPYLQVGYGFDIDSSEGATVYAGGIRARKQLAEMDSESIGLTWGTKVTAAGYNPENGNEDSLKFFGFGFDFQFPQSWRLADRQTFIGLSIYTNYYSEKARFENLTDDNERVKNEVTVSLALGGKPDFEWLGVTFERLGIGYKKGDNIKAVLLVTDFPF